MRSLTLKLTLAFLFVGIIGAASVAVLARQRTATEFDQFVADRSITELAWRLQDYYEVNGSWANVERFMARRQNNPGRFGGHDVPDAALADETGVVIVAGWQFFQGDQASATALDNGYAIMHENQPAGWLLFPPVQARVPAELLAVESTFLSRINNAILLSAIVAILVALLVGVLLASTISRPVRELTAATKRIAGGELGLQVPVRTKDELGELSQSFNTMSSDLARSTQARRQMTADIAHDLRTPLSVIMGYTEALSDQKLHGSAEIYTVLHQEALLLNHLVDDLRTLSLADAGELTLVQRDIPAKGLLEDVALSYLALAEERGITIDVQVSDAMPLLYVDPERIKQLLGNLVSNAIRYTPDGGVVTLAAKATSHDMATLSVSDTGVGIAPDDLPYVFNRFYRSDSARSQDGSSGLGLAIAKSITTAHGGTISAESTVGVGTTFLIRLPIAAIA
ncbi:MAG: ATP-binding protein [Anaerolineae bacterium]|nr:ATP-binding protein [Anaerolineae bacterium]